MKDHVCTVTIDEGSRRGLVDQASKLEGIANKFRELGQPNHAACIDQAAELMRGLTGDTLELRFAGEVVLPTTPQVPS